MSRSLRRLLADGTARLSDAGTASPGAEARVLLGHATGLTPTGLLMADVVSDDAAERFDALVERRARHVPVQHLTGQAHFRHRALAVGPGVFVPRPETEAMAGWAVNRLCARRTGRPVRVVELCAGSGAIAAALATEVDWAPGELELHAVELSEDAAEWASRNLDGLPVTLHLRDMAGCLPELNGTVDLVIANPPYIPLDAYESVPIDVRDHDPALALWSGQDGLEAIRVLVTEAARLLREGGLLAYEHAEVQAAAAPAIAVASGRFDQVRDHLDLNGRPRFVTAVRRPLRG